MSAPFFFCFRALLTRWGVRQAINLDGSSPEAYYLRGEALYKTQNMVERLSSLVIGAREGPVLLALLCP